MAAKKRILKVFGGGEAGTRLLELGTILENYDAFTLLEATQSNAERIAQNFPTEDITDQFIIQVGRDTIDTSKPRMTATGKVAAHPAYRHVKRHKSS